MPSYVCDWCHEQLGSDLAVIHNGSQIHLDCKTGRRRAPYRPVEMVIYPRGATMRPDMEHGRR
jgi:hypothetical protein